MQYYNNMFVIQQKENPQQISQVEVAEKANKSPKDTPTKTKKNNKDAVKKKDENAKDEKQDTNVHVNASSANKEAKEQQKETPVKEVKEVVVQQLSNKEPKKTKKKNDILSQIGRSLFFLKSNFFY